MTFELETIREEINNIDNEILELLEERMELAQEIGEYKKEHGIDILDKAREAQVLEHCKQHTSLSPEFVEKIFKEIMEESRKVQEHVISKN